MMIEEIILLIVILIFCFAGLSLTGSYFYAYKAKLSDVFKFVKRIDEALYDKTITEKEFIEIWESAKELLNYKIKFDPEKK